MKVKERLYTVKNKIMLITYADSMGGDLPALNRALVNHFQDAVGGVHLLPFFPSSGDRGFAPLCYNQVEPAFGSWEDVSRLGEGRRLMVDFMINHLSRQSAEFLDFLAKHEESQWRDLFLRYKNFWPQGTPSPEEVERLYKRKPCMPCVDAEFADGSTEKIWCTFGDQQMDLDVRSETTRRFITDSLNGLMDRGAALIRLDAFAFAVKKLGTSCFFVEPDMWELLDGCKEIADKRGVELLLEMHDHYTIQQKLADHGYVVYDFALPVLMLHTLYTGSTTALKNWLEICPRNCHTTLDTHDGMGIADIKDLLTDSETENVIQRLMKNGANVKWSFKEGSNQENLLNAYQMNATYYSALEENENAYLTARAIQFFCPGTPQVYYVGLLAGKNDEERYAASKLLTDVNRHSYTETEISEAAERGVVKRLKALMQFRNGFEAFDGSFEVEETPDDILRIVRSQEDREAILTANVRDFTFEITCKDGNTVGTWQAFPSVEQPEPEPTAK